MGVNCVFVSGDFIKYDDHRETSFKNDVMEKCKNIHGIKIMKRFF